LDLHESNKLLDRIAKQIDKSCNGVRYASNGSVLFVGSYLKPLVKQPKATAKKIGVVKCDMGDTACRVPLATSYIEKIEAAGRVGKKRNTIKC